MEKRNNVIDIFKAIGIISVITGHCCHVVPLINFPISRFVYSYHLMIFFFVSGFCYNEKKYANHPEKYVYKRIIKIVSLFFLYNLFFVLIHNILVDLSLIFAPPYSGTDMFIWIINGFLMNTNESMLGAFWFLPMFLIANLLFGIEFSLSSLICKRSNNKSIKYIIDIIFLIICILIAYYTHSRGLFLFYHVQTSFLAVPIIYFGWLIKKYYLLIEKHINVIGLLISFLIIIISITVFNFNVELSENIITNLFGFYLISISGIYFCFSLSKIISRARLLNEGVVFIGKNSFHFMALHFLCFKFVDLLASINTIDILENRMKFPCSYQFGFLYLVFSVAFISVIIIFINQLKKKY